jgi:hypothetical protein
VTRSSALSQNKQIDQAAARLYLSFTERSLPVLPLTSDD